MRPLFEYARLRAGTGASNQILKTAGLSLSLSFLLESENWIGFQDFLSLLAALSDLTGDPDVARRAGRAAAEVFFDGIALTAGNGSLSEAIEIVAELINSRLSLVTRLSPLIIHQGHAAVRVVYCAGIAPSRSFGQFLLGLFSKAVERFSPCEVEARLVDGSVATDVTYQMLNLTWQAPLRRKREIALTSLAAGGVSYGVASLLRSRGNTSVSTGITTIFGMALGACLGYQLQTQRYVHGLLKTSEDQNQLLVEQTHMLEETIAKNRKITSQAIEALAQAIEAKDPYTCGHSRRVAEYSGVLARAMNLPATTQQDLFTGALLHDIGKIGVPDSVLLKEGKLTAPEFQLVKQHTVIGYDMLLGMEFLDDALSVVRHHHERWDGAGYPNGLAGDAIPPLARIVGLADAFDAMTSNRTYRRRLNYPQIRSEIERGRGRQFAPDVVDAFFTNEDFFSPMAPS
ncbi:MAG TPA: HD-GYP domain-containing protein [Capsulimonadaceae bacterium]|nr:HD-GYP domain-containing protein [Capsulimonadaceae bacterium]